MERISFQGRNLATARRVWESMLEDHVTIFLGVAGALSAGGLRSLIAYLIDHRYVDCVVSTGANLYHDLHETRGRRHFVGSPRADDKALQHFRIDRVYDTYADETEFIENDEWLAAFALSIERRPYTSRELLYRLGERLWKETRREGILTAAYRASVPIFCPAIADSSIGMGLSQARHLDASAGQIDIIGDVIEAANVVLTHPRTASVVLGGGTPKNFINQSSVQAEVLQPEGRGAPLRPADRDGRAPLRGRVRLHARGGPELGQGRRQRQARHRARRRHARAPAARIGPGLERSREAPAPA